MTPCLGISDTSARPDSYLLTLIFLRKADRLGAIPPPNQGSQQLICLANSSPQDPKQTEISSADYYRLI